MTHALRIHSFPLSGHAHRVELLASLAGIGHTIVNVDLPAGEQRQPAFLALNPAGQIPVIEDGDVVISDSNAILVYLARRYAPSYLPSDPVLEAQVQRFLSMAAGEIAFGLAGARRITVFKVPLDVETCKAVAEKALSTLEAHMNGRDFLVGKTPTIADVAIYTYTAHAPEGNVSLEPYPNVRRLLANMEALPGFKPMQITPVGLMA